MGIRRFLAVSVAVSCAALFLFGCGERKDEQQKTATQGPGTVEYMVGAAQAKSYQRVKAKIADINKEREEQNKDAGL